MLILLKFKLKRIKKDLSQLYFLLEFDPNKPRKISRKTKTENVKQ